MLGRFGYPTIRAGLFGTRATSKMMSVVVALVLLVLSVAAFAAAQSTTQYAVHEPLSGTSFPVSLTPPGGATPHWITGVALRQRTIFQVNIYAFGLYVDAEGARKSLSRFTGMSASTLESDGSFYQQLLDLDFAMTLRLVMLRAVDGDELAEAFGANPLIYCPVEKVWKKSNEVFWENVSIVDANGFPSLMENFADTRWAHGFFVDKIGVPESVDFDEIVKIWNRLSAGEEESENILGLKNYIK